jgi:putative sugar O-methyltransferase
LKLVLNPKISFPSDFGKIHGAHHNGSFYQVSTFRHNYYAYRIDELTNVNSTVVEIGAGYGAVPYQLFENYDFQGSYIIFDLPEMLVLCAAFLKQALPNVDIRFNDIEACLNYKENQIVLMPHYSFSELKPMSVDMVFNAHSLTELDYSVTSSYLSHIAKISKHYFLSFNHEHRLAYKTEGRMKAHSCLIDEDFLSILTQRMSLVYRFPEIIQNRPFNDTYYEYLFAQN